MVERFGVLKLIIEDDEGRKTVVPFVRDEITIGRQEGNTIRLTERNVSRRHARLMRNNGHVLIEDLGSYNGIRINGDRISGQVQVADGDLIQIGDYDLALQAEEQAGATVPLEAPAGATAPTRKLQESAATMPALPAVDAQEAADEDVRDADEGEVGKDEPPSIPKHQSTAVIRIDQLDAGTKRRVAEIDAGDAPRLVVLNTDFAGREFTCNRTEMKIGRTDDNDIALDHRSLSRTHCKVVREESGEWRVIDMQSANGLMVNGEPYAQVTLRAGDVIELGHVKLKFVGPGEQVNIAPTTSSSITAESDQPVGSKTPLIAIAVTVLVVILGGGGYMAWKSTQGGPPAKDPKEKPVKDPVAVKPPPTETPPSNPATDVAAVEAAKKAAQAKVVEAKQAALELDFNKAEALAKDATGADGMLLLDAKALLGQLDSEKGNRNALEQAGKFLDAGNLEKAKTQLDSAQGTKLLKAKYDELESRRAKAVADKVAAAKQPEVKVETPRPPPEVKAPPEVKNPPAVPKNDPRLVEAEALFKEASDEKKAKNFERAAIRGEKCIKTAPSYAPCYRLLGTIYASIAQRDNSLSDREKARKYYERFLEVAQPDDEYVPKVKALLEAASQ
jgi:pSer/pThr/pTyr-binding forkhead associated (FHA) protein